MRLLLGVSSAILVWPCSKVKKAGILVWWERSTKNSVLLVNAWVRFVPPGSMIISSDELHVFQMPIASISPSQTP